MRYIKEFANASALQTAVDNGELGRPYLCYLQDQGKIAWDSEQPGPTPHDYSKDYLTFRVTGNGVIKWVSTSSSYHKTISYSKDNGNTWNEITSDKGSSAPSISVTSGDIVKFKGNNSTYGNSSDDNTFRNSTAQFDVEGNIMSLVYGDNFSGQTTLENSYNFYRLFLNCTGLTSAENLVLPATTLASACYTYMFRGCTSLTTAPELPATTLAGACYDSMFSNCTGLTTAPVLPATKFEPNCYNSMFYNCTSLNYIK